MSARLRWPTAAAFGLAAMLAWAVARMPRDPLFADLAISAGIAAFGIFSGNKHIPLAQ